ncbi:DUF2252 domain-containing protein [Phormidesmis priestleyi ULC007]|uniref:DUF2252 domain-containing protein n=1 Tax=Phormidesmis priestleyi ULC007 TaxID=1920490 RepID=A0A2T1DNF1_9CYAN|nr:DUF2252 domain-containing protein [Phormidesmis priestleyi]PSB21991.1 DUF2252 domain-containing protein [Phormidesmis priestleyi ULC007]PZO55041.1 MAG: DUF2252 domain-containing protein [Phormidesmis priestleyi]
MENQLTDRSFKHQAEGRSVAERLAAGKALRQKVKRTDLAEYHPPANRQDPIAILEAQTKTRLPELVPICYARMLTSPFAFLRGSAAVMIQDIALAPTTGINVQACGDMHLSNFGVFASAERNLVFGINDFDETYPGAWEWDLKRLVASAVVAGRFLGGDRVLCEAAVRAVVQSYRQHLYEYAEMGYLDLWYANITEADLLQKLPTQSHKRATQLLVKARQRTHLQVLEKMTDLVDDQHHIIEDPPLVVRIETTPRGKPMVEAIEQLMQDYLTSLSADRRFLVSRYRIVDVARKVVGVGSVGTRCWVIYLEGIDAGDPLFLQIKEAQPSILAPYAETLCNYRLPDDHQGHRVVTGQRLIQGAPDIFLGWGEMDGIQYYIRQLRDMKGGVKLEPSKFRLAELSNYCGVCGWALALAHAKSSDAAMLSGYVGKSEALDEALTKFAHAYADQTDRDYDQLAAAAKQGRIQVASEF